MAASVAVALAGHAGVQEFLASLAHHVEDDVGELRVDLSERLLHMLDAAALTAQQHATLAPARAQHTNGVRAAKRAANRRAICTTALSVFSGAAFLFATPKARSASSARFAAGGLPNSTALREIGKSSRIWRLASSTSWPQKRLLTIARVRRDNFEVKAHRTKRFWQCLDAWLAEVQTVAHRNFAQPKVDPKHPSLPFKTVGNGRFDGVRVGLYYRALGLPVPSGAHGFWVGTHGEYDKLVG